MFEYVAALVGMQQADSALMARAEAKETNRPQIVQTTPPPNTCSYKDDVKIKECLKAKFKFLEKIPDPYQDMWDPNWINRP